MVYVLWAFPPPRNVHGDFNFRFQIDEHWATLTGFTPKRNENDNSRWKGSSRRGTWESDCNSRRQIKLLLTHDRLFRIFFGKFLSSAWFWDSCLLTYLRGLNTSNDDNSMGTEIMGKGFDRLMEEIWGICCFQNYPTGLADWVANAFSVVNGKWSVNDETSSQVILKY